MAGRKDLLTYEYKQARLSVLRESRVCSLCGHDGADTADHIVPVSRGGDPIDRSNLAPIHGVRGCPTCGRKCNGEKSDKLPSEVERIITTRDWYSK